MELETQLHTIFLLVGPSNCGKTYFCQNFLITQLSQFNVQYLSSDDIRCKILNQPSIDKYDNQMLKASVQAFDILYNYLDNVTQFPINCHFAIVDTTGLRASFREKIYQIANKNHYNVELIVFNYGKEDKITMEDNETMRNVIKKHHDVFKRETLKDLRKEQKKCHYIKAPISNLKLTIKDQDLYQKTKLNPNSQYLIIGDVHECIDEVKTLLTNYGFKIENNQIQDNDNKTEIIFVGDLIDKGSKTKETIEFFYSNRARFKIVRGNHDHAIKKLLMGTYTNNDPKFIETCYTSYKSFDDELARKFLEIEAGMMPYYHYQNEESRSFYVTHAPCGYKYVGKHSSHALKRQQYMFLDRSRNQKPSDIIEIQDNSYNMPYLVSGHFAFKSEYYKNNRILIDTGCISGNKLTAVLLGYQIKSPRFFSVKFANKQPKFDDELQYFDQSKPRQIENTSNRKAINKLSDEKVVNKSLDPRLIKRIQEIIKNKINYISGTISPADKNGDNLESLEAGLKYYYQLDPEMKLSLEPKYMGSRCQVYLFLEIESCYAVTRIGHKINPPIFEQLIKKFKNYMVSNKIKMMIIDGELMPWSYLGSGLINKSFKPIDLALKYQLDILEETGFESAYNALKEKMSATNFRQDFNSKSAKELIASYGTSTYQTYKELINESHISINELRVGADKYHQQIELYGSEGEVDYKPFTILKIIYEDGKEIIPDNQIELFHFVSNDKPCIIDFKFGFEACLNQAQAYFDILTNNEKMEGIVIKPNVNKLNIAPCLKIRNKNYLTLIYGPDYETNHKYNKLIKNKNIRKKLSVSIKEYNIGFKMLQMPYDQLDNENYVKILIDFFGLEKIKVDPRL